jgi:hypothetical protein
MRFSRSTGISSLEFSDCGRNWQGFPWLADWVVYNVLVRGDETRSTVKVTASWESTTGPFSCSTRGTWESLSETAIADRASR